LKLNLIFYLISIHGLCICVALNQMTQYNIWLFPQGTVNVSATYSTRSQDIESSVVARGDLWRLEASRNGSTSGNDTSPLYLVQLGPLLFVRDSTLLLPVHLSKQHLLWYGYDRKVLFFFIASFLSVNSPPAYFSSYLLLLDCV
jgi:hypothetical protein